MIRQARVTLEKHVSCQRLPNSREPVRAQLLQLRPVVALRQLAGIGAVEQEHVHCKGHWTAAPPLENFGAGGQGHLLKEPDDLCKPAVPTSGQWPLTSVP